MVVIHILVLMKTSAILNNCWCLGDVGWIRRGAHKRHTTIVHANDTQFVVVRNPVKLVRMDLVQLEVTHHPVTKAQVDSIE